MSITTDEVDAWNSADIAALTVAGVESYSINLFSPEVVELLNTEQLSFFSDTQFSALTTDEISSLSEDQIISLITLSL